MEIRKAGSSKTPSSAQATPAVPETVYTSAAVYFVAVMKEIADPSDPSKKRLVQNTDNPNYSLHNTAEDARKKAVQLTYSYAPYPTVKIALGELTSFASMPTNIELTPISVN